MTLSSQPPIVTHSKFKGPPFECWHCGGKLKKGREGKHSGSGCLIILVGLLLAPLLIGIPIILYGIYLGGKANAFWQCRNCHSVFPRMVKWYQLE